MLIIERTPFEKGAFLVSLSRPLIHFFYNRAPQITCPSVHITEGLFYRKNQLKVFGKGFGEEPFLRKVFPDK
jgi:hypothetical protein